jgi:class 3 adenylate cyclase
VAVQEKLSVVFGDMRGFTRLCMQRPWPQDIQTILNQHLGMLASVVVRRGGIVNKFIGDSVLAIFRGSEGPANAVKAALDMVEEFSPLRAAWAESDTYGLDFLDIGVGIATDERIILGNVTGDKFREFTVVGMAVNLAAALENEARGGKQILCDQLTFRAIKDARLVEADGPFKLTSAKFGEQRVVPYYQLKKSPDASFDVFFSYRRDGGADVARAVQQALRDEFKIFLDVDRLGAGHFDTALLRTIEAAPNFVVFLSKGSLDRCQSPDDWLRKEIGHALRTGRNIVPVVMDGFQFPPAESLPEEIRDLVRHDAVPHDHAYFHPMIDKIRQRLKKK